MATRQRPGDLGSAEARRQAAAFGREIREARLGLGVSIQSAARRAGISPAQHGWIERAELRRPTFEHLCRAARAVGLDSPLKAYPSAVPVRDRGQLGVIARLEPLVARPLTVAREVGLPEVRDDPGTAVVILVVARSAHNRRVLAEHREALRQQFPLDGAAIARSLRHGLVPRESGIIAF